MRDTTPSQLLPLNEARALIHAAARGDSAAIDEITDRLAQQGVCRPRSDMSRMAEWISHRPETAKPMKSDFSAQAIAAVKPTDIGSLMAAHFAAARAGAQA